MAKKFQSVFDPPSLDEPGSRLDFCRRQRLIMPYRFSLSMVALMASQEVESIAGWQRQFNGKRLKSCQDRDFKAVVSTFAKKQHLALTVEWSIDGKPFRL